MYWVFLLLLNMSYIFEKYMYLFIFVEIHTLQKLKGIV